MSSTIGCYLAKTRN